ncbi:MAG: PIG-L deacetylase family protein [Candidatus Dormibacterales bacterium]
MTRARPFSGPLDPRVRRVLCIAAHPDDAEYFCAGSILLMARRGARVSLVLCTSGDKGTDDLRLTGPDLARMREEEQGAAAAALGLAEVVFLRGLDAELEETVALRRRLVGQIRGERPDLLLTFDPRPGLRQHPDHRVAGRCALDAAWPCARDRLTYPEQGPPHKTSEAWLFGGADADLEVDVAEVLEEKIKARLLHRSQTKSPPALRARWRRMAGRERFRRVDLR